jgi:hypothetical protein
MTKKHYEAIADAISHEATTWHADTKYAFVCQNIADNLADYFQKENPLFNRQKFMQRISDNIKMSQT